MATREITDEQAAELAERLADIEAAASDIRNDWSDPRQECRDIKYCVGEVRRLLGFV